MKEVHDVKILPASMQKEPSREEKLEASFKLLKDKFPRLHQGAKLLWGNKEFEDWINKLILSDRPTDRDWETSFMLNLL